MEKDKITYVVKSLLAAFLSIWTLIMLGLPLFTVTTSKTNLMPSMPMLNGYFLLSLPSANIKNAQDPVVLILTTCLLVILSLAIAFAIIGLILNAINFFIHKHSMKTAVSAFSIINCISCFFYMILSIILVIIVNKALGTEPSITAVTHTYLYFCVSLLLLILYFISQPLINSHYKKIELQNTLEQSYATNKYTSQHQPSARQKYVNIPTINAPKAVKTPDINVFDELIKYKELLDENIITQEEFERMKSRIFKIN